MNRRLRAGLLLLGLIVVALVFYVCVPREPTVDGRTVSYWIDQLAKASHHNGDVNADVAVRALGPEAIPFLVQTLKRRDDSLHDCIIKVWFRLPSGFRRHFPPPQNEAQAREFRVAAARFLGSMRDAAAAAAPALQEALNDPAPEVQVEAAFALSRIDRRYNRMAVPVLMQLHRRLTYRTTFCLGRVGPDAKSAVPLLQNALNNPNSNLREVAVEALQRIDPEAAAKAGIR